MAGISPIRQGQTDPPAHLKFLDDLGKPLSFPAGTTFRLYLYQPKTNVTVQGAGTFTLTNLAQGLVDYQWAAQDVATPGLYKVYAQYTLPSGSVGYGDEEDLFIKPVFAQQ